jgi:hypothetical protein
VNYVIIGVLAILAAQTQPGNPPEHQSSSGLTEPAVHRTADSVTGDSSARTTAGLRGVTRNPSGFPLDSVKLIVRSGDTPFFLNHRTRLTHLSEWLNSSAATDNIKGFSHLRITKLTKGSVPTKIDSKR